MEVKTKQRWVGLVILLAIAAIFLPLVFHNTNPTGDFHSSAIPSRPVLTITSPRTAPQTQTETQTTQANSFTAVSASPTTPTPAATAVDTITTTDQPSVSTSSSTTDSPTTAAAAPTTTVMPTMTTPEVSNAPVNEATSNSTVSTTTASPTNIPPAPAAPPTVNTAKVDVSEAWCIQLGTFENIDHANLLISQLRAKGFDAYTRPVLMNGQHWLRVYVGPEVRKEIAMQLKDQLESNFHLKGIVRKYNIT